MLMEARAGINLTILQGYWKANDRIWTISQTGKALLDDEDRGSEYDLVPQGEGMQMTIMRMDGWKVDIERTTKEHMRWIFPGQVDLEWVREPDELAKVHLDNAEKKRAAME